MFWRKLAAFPVVLYQKTFSFDHGPFRVFYPHGYCRFYPTCSEYTRQSIIKYGVFSGYFRGIHRILRCHPWAEPRVDKP